MCDAPLSRLLGSVREKRRHVVDQQTRHDDVLKCGRSFSLDGRKLRDAATCITELPKAAER